MTNLASFSLLKEKVNKYQQDNSLEEASLAFNWLALEVILGLNADEIEEAITDGPMDGGIDAIYVSSRTVHIFNFKYTSEFAHTKNRFPEGETSKVLVTMESVFSKEMLQDDVNAALWDKINEIWDAFEQGSLNFRFYLCSNVTVAQSEPKSFRSAQNSNFDKRIY